MSRRRIDPRASVAASFPVFSSRLADVDFELAELQRAEPTEVIVQHVAELQSFRDRIATVFYELERQLVAARGTP